MFEEDEYNKSTDVLDILLHTDSCGSGRYLDHLQPYVIDETGTFDSRFSTFYTKLCQYIVDGKYEDIYELSDKALSKESFVNYIKRKVGHFVEETFNINEYCRSIGVFVAPPVNQLIGCLDVVIYRREKIYSDILDEESAEIKMFQTKLYFQYKVYSTYSYQLISVFNDFKEVPISN